MYSKMQVMERLNLLSAAFEDVVRAVESLEAHYETVGDSSRLTAVALELEAVEEDFNEIERIVIGYLNSSPSQSGTLSVSRTTPMGQSPIKEQSERLEQELNPDHTCWVFYNTSFSVFFESVTCTGSPRSFSFAAFVMW